MVWFSLCGNELGFLVVVGSVSLVVLVFPSFVIDIVILTGVRLSGGFLLSSWSISSLVVIGFVAFIFVCESVASVVVGIVAVGVMVTLHCCMKLVNCDVSNVIACIMVSMSARSCLLVALSDVLFDALLIVLAFCCSAIRRSSSCKVPMRLSKLLQ